MDRVDLTPDNSPPHPLHVYSLAYLRRLGECLCITRSVQRCAPHKPLCDSYVLKRAFDNRMEGRTFRRDAELLVMQARVRSITFQFVTARHSTLFFKWHARHLYKEPVTT